MAKKITIGSTEVVVPLKSEISQQIKDEAQLQSLVFDTQADLEAWILDGSTEHDGFLPSDLSVGQNIYTIPVIEPDFWVKSIPVVSMSNLEILGSEIEGVIPSLPYAEKEVPESDDEFYIYDGSTKKISYEKLVGVVPNVYEVGVNKKYETITQAVNKWESDGKPIAEIRISKGTYNEYLNIGGNVNLSFIGEDKHNTIWRYDGGYYAYAPLTAFGGEHGLHIKNLTIISTHDDVPDYEYLPLSTDLPLTEKSGAYCLHFDHSNGGLGGIVTVDNCILINHQTACIGSGTRKDQTIKVTNTEMFTYAAMDEEGGDVEARFYGAMLWHSAISETPDIDTNQVFILKNCYMFSENGPAASLRNNGLTSFVNVIENNTFRSKRFEDLNAVDSTVNISGTYFDYVDLKYSRNNNIEVVNADNYKYVLEDHLYKLDTYGENIYDINSQSTIGNYQCTAEHEDSKLVLTPSVSSGEFYVGNISSYNGSYYYIPVEEGKKYKVSFDCDAPRPTLIVAFYNGSNTYLSNQAFGASKTFEFTVPATAVKAFIRYGLNFGYPQNVSVTEVSFWDVVVLPIETPVEKTVNDIALENFLKFGSKQDKIIVSVTSNRPSIPTLGQQYFDTDLGIPIWFDGTGWVKADGTDADA